jgi:predicted permease
LSHGLSLRHFGEPAAAVGRTVRVNGTPFTVAGVAPPGFFGADPEGTPALYLPLQTGVLLGQIPYRSEGFYWIEMMGRLKPGVTLERAQAALAPRFRQFIEASAETEAGRKSLPELMLFDGSGGLDSIRHRYATPLMMLIAMAALILLIACANIANLLLARSAARGREIAVRLSMGAARGRVVRQLLTESVTLACMGALPGVAFAWWSIRFLTALLATGQDGFTMRAELNGAALAVALGLAVVTGILFGLAPALKATSADTMPALREVRTGATRSAGRRAGLSGGLVAVQIALALLLMVGAGVFGRTLVNLHGVELGFNPRNVLLFSINTAGAGYQGRAAYDVFEELRQRFARAPGVRAASLSFRPLPAGSGTLAPTAVAGARELPPRDSLAGTFTAGPSFFRTMEIPLLLGREFDERDTGARLVAIVNERLLRLHGIEDPLGRTIRLGLEGDRTYEIVGVARDALFLSLKRDLDPMVYFPLAQAVRPPLEMTFELRTTGDPLDFAPSARQIVRETDPRLAVADLRSQEAHVDRAISREILLARLCTFFAALALAIACVGLYGTVAYAVVRRTSEIGIRMALGAQRGRVLWMVLRQVMLTVTAGLILGLPLAYAAASLADAFVFRMEAQDPATLAAAVAVLIAAAGLASYIPARRASRIDPVVALRNE